MNQLDSVNEQKYLSLIEQLITMGYESELDRQTSVTGLITIIEGHQLDVSKFDFPEGNWEQFKQALVAGKYDEDIQEDVSGEHMRGFVEGFVKGERFGCIDLF